MASPVHPKPCGRDQAPSLGLPPDPRACRQTPRQRDTALCLSSPQRQTAQLPREANTTRLTPGSLLARRPLPQHPRPPRPPERPLDILRSNRKRRRRPWRVSQKETTRPHHCRARRPRVSDAHRCQRLCSAFIFPDVTPLSLSASVHTPDTRPRLPPARSWSRRAEGGRARPSPGRWGAPGARLPPSPLALTAPGPAPPTAPG